MWENLYACEYARLMRNHVFVYVLDRSDDPFLGIKNNIAQGGDPGSIIDIKLSPDEYACIRRVEYTWRRYVRFLYYRKIFLRLKKVIGDVLRRENDNIVYMSDEGIWGVFLNQTFRASAPPFVTVNVQHGFFELNQSGGKPGYKLRSMLNTILLPLLKGPAFGYGFGGSGFDIYLCYGADEEDWLRQLGHDQVYACPELIKWDFVQRYRSMEESSDMSRVVFILPALVPGASFGCGLPEFLQTITPLIEYLAIVHHCRVTIRMHPGGNAEKESAMILASPLVQYVEVDQERDIANTLASNPVVLSAHSTALFEAQVVGRCAIAVSSRCYDRPIHYLHRVVDLQESGWEEKLDTYLEQYTKKTAGRNLDEFESCDFLQILQRRLAE